MPSELQTLKHFKTEDKCFMRRFAVKCTKDPKTQDMFPTKKNIKNLRNTEKFQITRAKTDRLAHSAIPTMQRVLNMKDR